MEREHVQQRTTLPAAPRVGGTASLFRRTETTNHDARRAAPLVGGVVCNPNSRAANGKR